MARRKRIPYKPDAFQSHGRRLASVLLDRGRLIVAGLVLAVVGFIVAAIVTSIHATAEDGAWESFGRSGGDVEKLRAALEEYGSCEARPFVLFALARAEIQAPTEEGKPKPESDDDRAARLARAEDALGELTDDYPGHFLHFYALCLSGKILEERGDYRDAAAVFETALASSPKSVAPKLEYDIGRNYYLAGMPKIARSHLERMRNANRMVQVPFYGNQTVPMEADWIGNGRYLLARIGPGEEAISLEEPEKKPEKKPETPEKALDENAPPAKNAPKGGAAGGGAAGASAPKGE